MREKIADDDKHKQSTMRRSEYNAITITTSDSVKQLDYNLSYNLSQNSLNLSHKFSGNRILYERFLLGCLERGEASPS